MKNYIQNIIFFLLPQNANTTGVYEKTLSPELHNSPGRRKRAAELSLITSPPTFTATVSKHTQPTGVTASSLTHSGFTSTDQSTNTGSQPSVDFNPTADPTANEKPGESYTSASHSNSTNIQSSDPTVFGTSAFSLTSVPPATLPPWLTKQTQTGDMTSDSSPLGLTPSQLRLSTHDASITGHFSTRSATGSGTTGGRVLSVNTASLNFLQPLLCLLDRFL